MTHRQPPRRLLSQRKISFRNRIAKDNATQRAKPLFDNPRQQVDDLPGDLALDVIVVSKSLVRDEDARPRLNGGTEFLPNAVERARLECIRLSNASEDDDRLGWSVNRLGTHVA